MSLQSYLRRVISEKNRGDPQQATHTPRTWTIETVNISPVRNVTAVTSGQNIGDLKQAIRTPRTWPIEIVNISSINQFDVLINDNSEGDNVLKDTDAHTTAKSAEEPIPKITTSCSSVLTAAMESKLGHSTAGFEMSLSVKCGYLGKVVDDMSALTVDKLRVCHTVLVNSFYVNGTFKELLTTFETTSQLLWTLPLSLPPTGPGQEITHSLWLLDTLQSYCRVLEYLVNASLLLSATPSSQAQLLVHPVGLSIGLFTIPRDPEQFVRMLQSQVLDVILPVLNHPKFPTCSLTFITAVISIVAHIYSGVGDLKHDRSGATGSTGQRIIGPPLDESTIATIVEMGFPRARAEEALRSVRTSSVELTTDWLFSHPEEVQEDDQLAQALALSLGTSSETSREDSTDETKAALEERVAEAPPIDDILNSSVKLFQSYDSVSFR